MTESLAVLGVSSSAAAYEPAPLLVRPALKPIPRWVIAAGIPVMVLVAVTAVWLLLRIGVDGGKLDAIRTGGTLGVGLGGVVVLWLAVRRQRSTELDLLQKFEAHRLAERIARHNESDAVERRITELYTKAVEQLGSDKAPVRLGGLYALERLAQNNKSQRQTIVDVVCAYLRMPYTLPASRLPDDAETDARFAQQQQLQEREVRLTAQCLIAAHLRAGPEPEQPLDTFWPDTDLDLTGATLIDLDLCGCQLNTARFFRATFVGLPATFTEATFAGTAEFGEAEFVRDASFSRAEFAGYASFGDAKFAGNALFGGAKFAEQAIFTCGTFAKSALFGGAKFVGTASFDETEFAQKPSFVGTKFERGVPVEVAHLVPDDIDATQQLSSPTG
ncbi:pentapeptide repeat-containing protein [Kibdelosporangium lantanae]|uniref:Pentapeptide repeat-containing protein n=1 Tax=Kibdelosporangium lantanae TaxID=1497396 RepID=A0ABW3M2M0_9PSEU